MNTIRSTWLGWGALCAAGGVAYYLAKREINADRQARHDNEIRRQERIAQIRLQKGVAGTNSPSSGSHASKGLDHAGSSSSAASLETASSVRVPEQGVTEKSKYEAAEPYRSKKGDSVVSVTGCDRAAGIDILMVHCFKNTGATFAASLLRPDVTKINRSELPHFHSLLETAMDRCSPSNIQKCKQWLLDNILPSSQRTSSFARYLTALAKYGQVPHGQKPCSSQRQGLHILYLLNDLLHHAKYHTAKDRTIHDLTRALQSSLLELVREASVSAKGNVRKRLETLLAVWQDVGYFEVAIMEKARKVMNDPSTLLEPSEKAVTHSMTTREAPYIMPATHGDPSQPFYELPAGNLMLHIIPNKAIPMHAHSIRPLQFAAGPADESLVNAVRDFLKDVETIDHEFDLLDDPNSILREDGRTPEDKGEWICKEFSKKFERRQKSKQKPAEEEV
ncbi:hypothetical protein DV738_g3119, partial [Chaetothyriales sp. CBS 135597]